MHWPCSNEDASKTKHAHSATTALIAGGSVAFHIGKDFGCSHCARVTHHDHGGVGSLPVRIFPFSEFGNRALSAYRLHFTARRAHPVSSRFIIRLLAAGSHRWQTSRPSRAPYYFAVPLFSARQYRAPISDRAAAWSIGWLLRPALTGECCIFG